MGYYASWGGCLKMKKAPDLNTLKELKYVFGNDIFYDAPTLEIYGHDKYHEEDVENILTEIENDVDSGEIEFTGEDESHWRFIFEGGKWKEESGAVYYDSEINCAQHDKDEFLGRIIDVIQDCIDNPQGDVIKDDWYDNISNELENIMKAWKVFL